MTSIWWVRRDLRLARNAALTAAAQEGRVLPVFVRDPRLAGDGQPRSDRLEASLAELMQSTGGALRIESGEPAQVIAETAARVGARRVHTCREFTPYARRREERVRAELSERGVELLSSGSPYAVAPGTVMTNTGTPFRVFTPFSRAWREALPQIGEESPLEPEWVEPAESSQLDPAAVERGRGFGPVGEQGALEQWRGFLSGPSLASYAEDRNRADLEGTSRMSAHLKFGEIHPLTMLADIFEHPDSESAGAASFISELAWREFYADVLWHSPASAWSDLREDLATLEYDELAPEDLAAWEQGRTGFPFVDAGMRQLLATGWMHNRLRMVTASFLVKDLHAWWPIGARYFMRHLIDADLASNNHGWQWVAGTGTDASPYFRVFNPVIQGKKFDPNGDFVRRWVPELAHIEGAAVHEPWLLPAEAVPDYPRPIVDHAAERVEALARHERAKQAGRQQGG